MTLLLAESVTVVFLGLALGSFATALIHRIPENVVWWRADRSSCPYCHSTLSVIDLVPLLSWLCLRGKCRHCSVAISWHYPVIELAVTAAALCAYFFMGFKAEFFFLLAALPFLTALFVIDLKYLILPDQLNIILFVIGLCRGFYLFGLESCLLLMLSGVGYGLISWGLGFLLSALLKKEAMGFGDVKFFFVAGVWLEFSALPYFMILSGVFSIFIAGLWRILYRKDIFPFGPALILSFYFLTLFFVLNFD